MCKDIKFSRLARQVLSGMADLQRPETKPALGCGRYVLFLWCCFFLCEAMQVWGEVITESFFPAYVAGVQHCHTQSVHFHLPLPLLLLHPAERKCLLKWLMTICVPLNNASRQHTQRDLKSQHYKGVIQARQYHQSTWFIHSFIIFSEYNLPQLHV